MKNGFVKVYSSKEIIEIYKLNKTYNRELIDFFSCPQYKSEYLEEAMNKVINNKVSYDYFVNYLTDFLLVTTYAYTEAYLAEGHLLFDYFLRLKDKENFLKIYEEIKLHNKEKELFVTKRHLSDIEKEAYINYFKNSKHLDLAEFDVSFYKECLEDLVLKDNICALDIQAYLYYGNLGKNYGYSCDYKKSEELLLKLMDNENVNDETKAFYANTLGYIYYYGRLNDGIREYDKAFKYYSFGAACGVYESIFKLSDMYKYGNGVSKSYTAAFNLVNNIYYELEERFAKKDFSCEYADVCIRMGNFYKNGIFVNKCLEEAYREYKKALFALNLRIKENDFFGDYKLKENIENNILELEEVLKIKKNKKTIRVNFRFLSDFISDGAFVSFKELKNKYKIHLKRIDGSNKLITFDNIDSVIYSDNITLYINKTDSNIVKFNDKVCNICRDVNGYTKFYNDNNDCILELDVDKILLKLK